MIYPHLQNHFHEIGFLISSIRGGSYIGIFLLSVFVGYLVPLPETVLLILFGFVGVTTNLNIATVFIVSFLGSIIGDNALYRLSSMGNVYVERFNRKMRKHKLIKYEHLVVDNIGKAVYFLRLIVGIRFFGPVIAGSLGVPWKKFFVANIGATFFNAAVCVSLGYFFHRRIFSVVAEAEIFRNMLLFSSAIIVAFLLSVFARKETLSAE